MAKLKYVTGDVTNPISSNKHIYILQICNDIGAYGAGVSGAISRKWPKVEKEYHRLYKNRKTIYLPLGNVQFVRVEENITVINMIAQHLVGQDENGGPCIRYEALDICLMGVAENLLLSGGEVHAPRIGSGYSSGDWNLIEKMILRFLVDQGINVTIYDLSK